MARFTLEIPDELNDWLTKQALKNERSKHKHIRFLLEQIKKENDKPRYVLGVDRLCYNGVHTFISDNPATNDYCTCRVFVFGELKQ